MPEGFATEIAMILFFVCLSAFFSGAETALTSVSPARARQLIDEGGWGARFFSYWITHPGRLLTTILVGNNVVNISASAVATDMATKMFGHGIAIAVGVMTFIILVFGEVVPKTVARHHSARLAQIIIPILTGLYFLFYPLVWVLVKLTHRIMSLLGIAPNRTPLITQKDLEYLIGLAEDEGALAGDRGRYLNRIIEFSKVRVREIMLPREQIKAIRHDASFDEISQYISQDGHSRYPVYRETLDTIEGFLHVKDLLKFLRQGDPQDFDLLRVVRDPFFVNEKMHANYVLNLMKRNRVHLAMVKNETQTIVGMITLEDILEEVFGEIEDEHDDASAQPARAPSGELVVDGALSVRDLKTRWNISLPQSDAYTTVGGFISHHASRQVLQPQAMIIYDRYVFRILAMSDDVVTKVQITEVT